jgi:tRNA pseudouridine55 synthase
MLSGILCVDKPRGMTSHDVVAAVRRMTGIRAVGHTGTLDPDASGMLLLCLGRATKFARFFEGLDKTYWTVMQLGICTDTQDATGRVLHRRHVPSFSLTQLQEVLYQFTGHLQQTPPMYSAVKYQGKRLYHLARRGLTVTRQARDIVVHRLRLLEMRGVWITLSVTCSKGTYIRTLCEDIGLALGCGAHMAHLQRCQVGPFHLKQAYTLDFMRQKTIRDHFEATLIPLAHALDFLPALSLTLEQYDALQSGQGSGREGTAILDVMPQLSQQTSSYRLRTQPEGTFAVIHRQRATPTKWKVSYLKTPPSSYQRL